MRADGKFGISRAIAPQSVALIDDRLSARRKQNACATSLGGLIGPERRSLPERERWRQPLGMVSNDCGAGSRVFRPRVDERRYEEHVRYLVCMAMAAGQVAVALAFDPQREFVNAEKGCVPDRVALRPDHRLEEVTMRRVGAAIRKDAVSSGNLSATEMSNPGPFARWRLEPCDVGAFRQHPTKLDNCRASGTMMTSH